jgi:drug/metabolite transporter (DMT)-like permease
MLEWLGVVIAVLGVCVSAGDGIKDILHGSHSSNAARALFGDFLCVVAGINEVSIILNRHCIKPYVPLMQVSH